MMKPVIPVYEVGAAVYGMPCRIVFKPIFHLTINSECLWKNFENALRIL